MSDQSVALLLAILTDLDRRGTMRHHAASMSEIPADGAGAAPKWPDHFPPGCPPADAADLDGTVYMLVATDPPTEKDFDCAIDRGTFIRKPECLRASLSCALDAEHLDEVRDASPRLRDHQKASAKLRAEHGKIKQTGKPGHHSMWLWEHSLRVAHTLFKVQP